MDYYIAPDFRGLDADVDYKELAAQDPVWVPPPPQPRQHATSRRDFIKGVIASGTAVSALSYTFGGATPARAQRAAAPDRLLSINVNGQVRRVDVLPQETLAMTLRYKLGLTGTKLGCDHGECGACTVHASTTSPHLFLLDADAQRARPQDHHDRRASRVRTASCTRCRRPSSTELGPQCGFCTPGQVMAAVALLKAQSEPDASTRRASRCPAISAAAAPTTTISTASCGRRREA